MSKKSFKGSVLLNPVPAVLVSCKNLEGAENVFTVAWIGTICSKPPMLSISIRPERLSYDYIKESGEFIVNLPSAKQTRETDYCGVKSGRTNDKIKEMNFTMIMGDNVKCSYIKECPINIECKVKEIIPLGSHHMFIAEVLSSHIDDKLIDEKGKIHFEKADLITYSHGEYFPVPRSPIGKFGYSVAKKPTKKKVKNKKL